MEKKEKKQEVTISIIDILETSFKFNASYNYTNFTANNLALEFEHKFSVNLDENKFGVEISISYIDSRDRTHLSELSVLFNFCVMNLKELIEVDEQGIKTKDNSLIINLLNVSTGTIRGILYSKLKGTPLDKFPLPLIPTNFFHNINNKK